MVAEKFVAALVHDYLSKMKCFTAANEFCKETGMIYDKHKNQNNEAFPTLDVVVEDYLSYKKMEKECATKELIDIVQSLRSQLDLVKVQLRLLTMKKALGRIMRKNGNSGRKPNEIDATVIQQISSTLPCMPQSHTNTDLHASTPSSTTSETTSDTLKTDTSQQDNEDTESLSDIEFTITPLTKQSKKPSSAKRNSMSDIDQQLNDKQLREKPSPFKNPLNKPLPLDCILIDNGDPSGLPVIKSKDCSPTSLKHQLTSDEVSRVISACVTIDPPNDSDDYVPDIYTTPVKKKSIESMDSGEYRSPKRKSFNPRRSSNKKVQPTSDKAVAMPKMPNLDSPSEELNQLIEALLNAPDLQEKIAENINKAVESVLVDEKNKKDEASTSQELNLSEVVDKTARDPSFEELFHALEGFGDIFNPTDFAEHGTYEGLSVDSHFDSINDAPNSNTSINTLTDSMDLTASNIPTAPSINEINPSTPASSSHQDTSVTTLVTPPNIDNLNESELKGVAMDALLMLAGCVTNKNAKEPVKEKHISTINISKKVNRRHSAVRRDSNEGFTPIAIHPEHNMSSINIIRLSGKPVNLVNSPHKNSNSPFGIGQYVLDKGNTTKKSNRLKRTAKNVSETDQHKEGAKRRRKSTTPSMETDKNDSTVDNNSINMLLCSENSAELTTIDFDDLNDTRERIHVPKTTATVTQESNTLIKEKSPNVSPKTVPKHLNIDEFLSTLNYDD